MMVRLVARLAYWFAWAIVLITWAAVALFEVLK